MSVKLRITGDNSSAMKAFGQVNQKVSGLSGNLNNSLKGAMAGAFSAVVIGAAVKSTLSFGDNIDKASQNLSVTTEYIQILQRVARDTGKDFKVLEKAIINVNDAADEALGGNKEKKGAFAMLGLTDEDLKTLNKRDLMTKVAQGAQNLPQAQAESAFTSLFGKKEAGMLLGVSGGLADPESVKQGMIDKGQMISDEDIAKMAEMQDAFEDLTASLKISLAPALTWLFERILAFGRGTMQLTELFGTALGAFSQLITSFDIKGMLTAFGENFVNTLTAIFDNAWALIRGKKTIGEVIGSVSQTVAAGQANLMNKTFGQENVAMFGKALDDKLLEFANEDKQRDAAKQARKDARAADQDALNGAVNRTGKEQKEKEFKHAELKSAPSSYVSIGGLAGVNLQYRIERINKDMLEVLRKILTTLSQPSTQDESGF